MYPSAAGPFKLVISSAELYVKNATLNEKVYRTIMTRMEKENVRLHFRRYELHNKVIPT